MRKLEITLSGGDSATMAHNQRSVSRLWRFPDGINRLIAMSGWMWDTHDRLIELQDNPNFFSNPAYKTACEVLGRDDPGFEDRLRSNFEEAILIWFDQTNSDTLRVANSNCYFARAFHTSGELTSEFHDARDGQ